MARHPDEYQLDDFDRYYLAMRGLWMKQSLIQPALVRDHADTQ